MGLLLAGTALRLESAPATRPLYGGYPFTLGVASGEPQPDGIVLWTRLAPDPLNGGGMRKETVPVRWEIARDDRFERVVRRGVAAALPELGHAVHVEATGLQPDCEYFYRFRVGGEMSPIGRTKTLPASGAEVARLCFAFASCQNYQDGYFTAYRHMRNESLDFVIHLGDYIYESGYALRSIRPHIGGALRTIEEYRNRYALYRMDSDLAAAHAAFPWIVAMDDHEVENNWAGAVPGREESLESFLHKRLAAFQAFYEHMPLRPLSRPTESGMKLYRRFEYGNLASFHMLDTRQYRDDQASGDGWRPPSRASADENRTLLGSEQEAWLMEGVASSTAVWNVVAQQVFFSKRDRNASAEGERVSMDAWDGYEASRKRLLAHVRESGVRNFVVLTGDVHSNWANEIKADFDDASSPTVGVEWVGTSISSGGDGADGDSGAESMLAMHDHLKFYNGNRGYVVCTATPNEWRTDYRVVPFVTRTGADIATKASFSTQAGDMKVRPV